eukprot:Gb_19255 [translate_table: standard]
MKDVNSYSQNALSGVFDLLELFLHFLDGFIQAYNTGFEGPCHLFGHQIYFPPGNMSRHHTYQVGPRHDPNSISLGDSSALDRTENYPIKSEDCVLDRWMPFLLLWKKLYGGTLSPILDFPTLVVIQVDPRSIDDGFLDSGCFLGEDPVGRRHPLVFSWFWTGHSCREPLILRWVSSPLPWASSTCIKDRYKSLREPPISAPVDGGATILS